jgi:hypothetical protein
VESKKVEVTCRGADLLPLDAIEEFQGNLKTRTKKDVDKVIASIKKYGFSFPFFVWNGSGHNYCFDGHGRIIALTKMREDGWELPHFPVDYIEAKNESEAKKKLLQLNSRYGKITSSGFNEFVADIEFTEEEVGMKHLIEEIQIPGLRLETAEGINIDEGSIGKRYEIMVECKNEGQQYELYDRLTEEGYQCRILIL